MTTPQSGSKRYFRVSYNFTIPGQSRVFKAACLEEAEDIAKRARGEGVLFRTEQGYDLAKEALSQAREQTWKLRDQMITLEVKEVSEEEWLEEHADNSE